MSVWIVASAHIDVLVLAGVQFGVPYDAGPAIGPGPGVLAESGADLWAENHRSVEHRYGTRTMAPEYVSPVAELLLDRVAVVKVIDCFVYQSGGHPGWSTSRAAGYCGRLRVAAMAGLSLVSGDDRYPIGWDEASWGIDRLDQASVASPASAAGRDRRP